MRLTCALAKLRMAVFARTLKEKLRLNNVEVDLAASYVDDFRFLIHMLEEGTRWDGEKLVWNPDWEQEDMKSGLSRERITAREICKVMNGICRDIEMTVEVEGDFCSGYIPTLDAQIKLDKSLGRISYKFYSKPMASKFCLLEESAIPITVRTSTLSQEVLRRQLNCSQEIGVQERSNMLEEFTTKIIMSGYSKLQMRDTMIAGLTGYANKVTREKTLGTPIHREGVSHGSLLLAQRQPYTLLAAGGGGHAHCVLVTRLLQTGSQWVVYTR